MPKNTINTIAGYMGNTLDLISRTKQPSFSEPKLSGNEIMGDLALRHAEATANLFNKSNDRNNPNRVQDREAFTKKMEAMGRSDVPEIQKAFEVLNAGKNAHDSKLGLPVNRVP